MAPIIATFGSGSAGARGFGRGGVFKPIPINQTFNAINSEGREGGIQPITVAGSYRIEVVGAQPPQQNFNAPFYPGGLPARMVGDFTFTEETDLLILVGQKPPRSAFNGGGGGSFVVANPDVPIIISGGGGSMRCQDCNGTFGSAGGNFGMLDATFPSSLGESQGNSNNTNSGGLSGFAGDDDFQSEGGAGAGFYGDAGNIDSANEIAALSFLSGGTGGRYSASGEQDGGFGGGGAGGFGGSGGGGGYNGGGAGKNCVSNAAGGGGSFITSNYSASLIEAALQTAGTGDLGRNGFVRIDSI